MIVTRFAPSPTGYIHIGNVRSAIYPYLLAKGAGGKMILRIEDTDRARYVEGATELIEDTLNWLGLEWDEGPIVGGPAVPYFQSERKDIYMQWAQKLLDAGRAYYDDTPPETIDAYRREAAEKKIPFLYRDFVSEDMRSAAARSPLGPRERSEAQAPSARGDGPDGRGPKKQSAVIRFKTDPKPRTWHDEVMGDMHAGPEVQDDIILIKADGYPTYNFAHIVDDAEMGVTHVMRGVEYLSSTPNYLALYEALNLEVPKLISLPHILAPTGNKKLGKRDGAKSATEYRDDGVLPEAMLNYLACLGWNDGTEQEIYTKEELIAKFSLDRIQNSGARYDETKLLWLNGQWLRRIFDEQGVDALYARIAGFWPEAAASYDDNYKKQVLSIIYDRLKTLSDLRGMTDYFFVDPPINLDMLINNKFLKKLSESELETLLKQVIAKLSSVKTWDADTLQNVLNELLVKTNKKPAELFSLIRISLSFAPFSPALNLTMAVLGRDTVLARLNAVAISI